MFKSKICCSPCAHCCETIAIRPGSYSMTVGGRRGGEREEEEEENLIEFHTELLITPEMSTSVSS